MHQYSRCSRLRFSTSPQVDINRGPVLVLWTAVVANAAGYRWAEGLSLGRCLATIFAESKGQRLGVVAPSPAARNPNAQTVTLMGRELPVMRSSTSGVVAISNGQAVDPLTVLAQMRRAFGGALGRTVQVSKIGEMEEIRIHDIMREEKKERVV